eukprot:684991-Pelagomonas_calceolata.AAC.1
MCTHEGSLQLFAGIPIHEYVHSCVLAQAAARLTQGLSKAEQASISSAMQGLTLPPPSQLTPPHHHQLPYTPQRAVPSVPQAPLTPQAPAIPQQQQQPQQELQGGTFTPANRLVGSWIGTAVPPLPFSVLPFQQGEHAPVRGAWCET